MKKFSLQTVVREIRHINGKNNKQQGTDDRK